MIRRLSTPEAFSLLELLAAIAVLGVLVALLVPQASRMRQKATAAACSNQMRQLHSGLAAYAADNNNEFLPAYNEVLPGLDRTWYFRTSPFADYVGGGDALQKATVCPELRGKEKADKNDFGYPYVVNYNVMRSNGTDKRVRLVSIVNPSMVILMTDTNKNPGWGYGFGDTSFSSFTRIGEPHAGYANVLWCDGHVSAMRRSEITNAMLYPDGTK